MAAMGFAAFEIRRQFGEGGLSIRGISGLNGGSQVGVIRVRGGVVAKGLVGRALGIVGKRRLQGGQGALGGRRIARLKSGAQRVQILEELARTALVGGLIR